jgi:hypothetical protein
LLLINGPLDRPRQPSRQQETAPQQPAHLPPSSITLRLSDLPRGFAVDYANSGPVSWHDLARLATARRLALLQRSGLIAEYDASFNRAGTWHGLIVDFLGVRTVATTFKTIRGATRAFGDTRNPLLTLTHLMRSVSSQPHEADEWQEAAHTDHTGNTTIVVRWRAGRITGGLVLFGSGSRATTRYARALAQISLRRALRGTRPRRPVLDPRPSRAAFVDCGGAGAAVSSCS